MRDKCVMLGWAGVDTWGVLGVMVVMLWNAGVSNGEVGTGKGKLIFLFFLCYKKP